MAPNPEVKQKEGMSADNVPSVSTQPMKRTGKKYNDRLITKIHGKYYDLTQFKHPGGPLALGCIDNRDGTELFESHHLFTKKSTLDILSSYEMNPAPLDTIPSANVFDWELTKNSEFTKELQEGARKILG
jgi:cytochrome b involved in lipid metabolism